MSTQEQGAVIDFPDPPDPGGETIFGISIDRIVAFVGPYIAILGGIVADWLIAHVHFLAVFHIYGNDVASAFVQLGIFGITAGLIWLGHQKWLSGRHIILANQGLAHQAAMMTAQAQLAAAALPPELPPPSPAEIDADAQAAEKPGGEEPHEEEAPPIKGAPRGAR
jgi:hypothetical protein